MALAWLNTDFVHFIIQCLGGLGNYIFFVGGKKERKEEQVHVSFNILIFNVYFHVVGFFSSKRTSKGIKREKE